MTLYMSMQDNSVVELLKRFPKHKLVKLSSREDGIYTYSEEKFLKEFKQIIILEKPVNVTNIVATINELLKESTSDEIARVKRICQKMLDNEESNYI